MFYQDVGKKHILYLCCRRGGLCNYLQVLWGLHYRVSLLEKYTTEKRSELLFRRGDFIVFEDNAVFLGFQDSECFFIIFRSDDNLTEAASTHLLATMIPPKADTGSALKASFQA